MRLEMMQSMGTLMVPVSLEIPAWATMMGTSLIRRIVPTVRSSVHRESCHWVVPQETSRNSRESEIVARES